MESQHNNLFDIAVNEETDINSLLSYYRERILDFDRERSEFIEKLHSVRFSQEVKHQLEWDLKRKTEECTEAKRALEESKLMNYEERTRNLELKRENNDLRQKEQKDRKKLEELMSITQPVEQDIILRKDLRPDVRQRVIKGQKRKISGGNYGNCGRTVLKTIYLPNEQLNTLGQENLILKNQMQEAEALHREQVEELMNQITQSQITINHMTKSHELQHKTILESNQKLECQILNLNKEYFTLRRHNHNLISELQEENSELRQKNVIIANDFLEDKQATHIRNACQREILEKKTQDYAQKCQNITAIKSDQLVIMQDQYQAIQKVYLDKIKVLQANLVKVARKYKAMQNQKNLQIEGYKTQIRNMREKSIHLKALIKGTDQPLSPVRLKNLKTRKRSSGKKLKSGTRKYKRSKRNVDQNKRTRRKMRDIRKSKENEIPVDLDYLVDDENDEEEQIDDGQSVTSLDMNELENLKDQLTNLEHKLDKTQKGQKPNMEF